MPLNFDFTPHHTFDNKGAKEVIIRATTKYKVRASLVLCCLADRYRFPPMLIFKEANGKLPKKLKNVYDERRFVLKANAKGWMNSNLLKQWVDEVWKPNINKEQSYLLIWDSFSAHKDEDIIKYLLEELDTEVAVIPGGCTSVLQPLDVGINKPVKDRLRKAFQEWSVERLVNSTGILFICFIYILEKTETKSGYIRGPERSDLIKWVGDAWRDISEEIIINAFMKSKLLENHKDIPQSFQQEAAQIPTNLDEMDIDNPYLDYIEEEWIDNSELDMKD